MEQAERASSSPPAAARRPRFDAGLGRGLLAFVSLAYAWVLGWTALSALVLLWVLAGFALGRQQGWAMDDEEYQLGHRCIGAPVFDYHGDAVAAISASGSSSGTSFR